MAEAFRVRYVGDTSTPRPGSVGTAYRCEGYHDPGSIEYGAYNFFPDYLPEDAEENGFYVGDADLEDLGEDEEGGRAGVPGPGPDQTGASPGLYLGAYGGRDVRPGEEHPCAVCGAPTTSAELCAACAAGNDPFFTSKYKETRGTR